MERIGSRRTGRGRGFGVGPTVIGFVTRPLRDFDDRLVTLCGCDDDGICDSCEHAAA